MRSIKNRKIKINPTEKKQKIGILVATTAAVLAISAGFIPNIAMTAWAAIVQCVPAQPCNGTPQSDAISGTNGADKIAALGGSDAVDARGGADNVAGGDDSDRMNGGSGNDIMSGGNGNDQMNGGNGNDLLTGGDGADQFNCGAGTDRIADFDQTEGDTKTADCESF